MIVSDTQTDKDKWNAIYQSKSESSATVNLAPAFILLQNQHLLPQQGKALDLASGLGANAIFLAQHNLQTHAWDISSTAIDKLGETAKTLNLDIQLQVRDVVTNPPEEKTFDVIVVSRFLERQIMPAIIAALRINGLLFYQTFTKERVSDIGPKSEDYRLAKNELLELCKDLKTVVYREEGLLGDTEQGFRNEALYIGQRL